MGGRGENEDGKTTGKKVGNNKKEEGNKKRKVKRPHLFLLLY
jgi:hypothetical protein